MRLPATEPPQAATILAAIATLRLSLTSTSVSTSRIGDFASMASLVSAKRVLGKARTAEAGPGVEELGADALVEADAARDVHHVGVDAFAQIGDLVDERDLHRQKHVGGVLIISELRREV